MDNINDLAKVENEYGADEIQVLEGLEAVRKRPGMYIGSTGEQGLHHLVYEIVDNSIDEALAGYCTKIEVSILPGNIIKVKDNGRGIPVGINQKMGLYLPLPLYLLFFMPVVNLVVVATRFPVVFTVLVHLL